MEASVANIQNPYSLGFPLIDTANRPSYKTGLTAGDLQVQMIMEIGTGNNYDTINLVEGSDYSFRSGAGNSMGLYNIYIYSFSVIIANHSLNTSAVQKENIRTIVISGTGFDTQTIAVRQQNIEFYQGGDLPVNTTGLATEANATANKNALSSQLTSHDNSLTSDIAGVHSHLDGQDTHLNAQDTTLSEIEGTGFDTANDSLVKIKAGQGISGTVNANLVSIDGELTNGNNATLNLKKLDIHNDNGAGIDVYSDNEIGVHLRGKFSGLEVQGTGMPDETTYGLSIINGMSVQSTPNAPAVKINSILDNDGVSITTEDGIALNLDSTNGKDISAKEIDGLLSLTDEIDGVTIEDIYELTMAMVNGNMTAEPIGEPANKRYRVTLYKRDGVTALTSFVIDDLIKSRVRD